MKDCLDNQIRTVLNIPYFDGDFWPNIIEQSIEGMKIKLEEEETEAIRATNDDDAFNDPIESEDPIDVRKN